MSITRGWTAKMITPDRELASAPLLRRTFTLETGHGGLTSAVLRITALGVCEAWINGVRASEDVLTPGWSAYEWRLRYAEWDVTRLVAPSCVLGIALGNGWYRGRLGFAGGRALYGDQRGALAELHLSYADGFTQTVATDTRWQSGPSAIVDDDLYDGQTIDARRLDPAWSTPEAGSDGWGGVRVLEGFDEKRLVPYIGPPIRRQQECAPKQVWISPSGRTLVDFGQNLVGWTRLRVTGAAGRRITIRHAEVLEHDELGTRPLRTAQATDRFVCSGGDDLFEPTFTFHGFRYAEVADWPGTTDDLAANITAVVVGSRLRRTGHFACSEPLLNQLHDNIVWSMRGNFVDVPTDCPQRDERLGWTGDLAAFAPTATYLFDVNDFLRDWLADLAVEQAAAGQVPIVVPDNFKYENLASLAEPPAADGCPAITVLALWSDAAVWVPWAVWEAYGDRRVLADQFESMTAHARLVRSQLSERGLLEGGLQLGDWLDPTAPPDNPLQGKSDPYVVATACAYRSAVLVSRAAAALGLPAEEQEFETMAADLGTAFNRHYVSADGRLQSDASAVYALAIAFGLLTPEDEARAGARLAELVTEAGHHVTTGFAGTPFLTHALSRTGHLDDAYQLLLQRECPSWLYPVTMGATTIWERWDSMLPDGSINPGEMTSFNHYAFGAVGDWMHRVVGGISALEPGYRTLLIAPQPGGGLTWAKTELDTPHGRASVHWRRDGNDLTLDATVPPGTTALVRVPGAKEATVGAGTHTFTGRIAPEVPLQTAPRLHTPS
ncbi:family 78 glycoside hydrolase catalytic domain [Pseudofrankia sp. BMG5.36]|uniref:family 78 glycoside hydrolase catalytic domain n=1 Tax=Pseudofrankia sp. BMG5.36 TaxID=1834512 RepID=UPI0008DA5AF6|nr:family 78 glycoside hydrolase catalytic domain [Pseudofrankia sp. BMG5.36]OHV62870.1 alpha-L-rhamnosidase [Pseudofrankia sp. BMG5.36]